MDTLSPFDTIVVVTGKRVPYRDLWRRLRGISSTPVYKALCGEARQVLAQVKGEFRWWQLKDFPPDVLLLPARNEERDLLRLLGDEEWQDRLLELGYEFPDVRQDGPTARFLQEGGDELAQHLSAMIRQQAPGKCIVAAIHDAPGAGTLHDEPCDDLLDKWQRDYSAVLTADDGKVQVPPTAARLLGGLKIAVPGATVSTLQLVREYLIYLAAHGVPNTTKPTHATTLSTLLNPWAAVFFHLAPADLCALAIAADVLGIKPLVAGCCATLAWWWRDLDVDAKFEAVCATKFPEPLYNKLLRYTGQFYAS